MKALVVVGTLGMCISARIAPFSVPTCDNSGLIPYVCPRSAFRMTKALPAAAWEGENGNH